MRGIPGCLVVGLALAAAVGCTRSAPAPAGEGPPASATVPAGGDGARPKFESELVHTSTLDGGTGSSTYKSTRNEDGKLFTVADAIATTIKGATVTLKFEVVFVAHRRGKDVYKVTYSVAKGGATQTTTQEAAYDGTRTVLVEDQYGSLVLQPPSR
jgi:hypothetical protein